MTVPFFVGGIGFFSGKVTGMGNTTELVQNKTRIVSIDGSEVLFEEFREYPGVTVEQAAISCARDEFPDNDRFSDGTTLQVEVIRDGLSTYKIPIVWTKCWKAFGLRCGS